MLQQDEPEDFVIATGEVHSVRELVEVSFAEIGEKIVWRGEGINEVGYDVKSGKKRVFVNERYYRPTEVDYLQGDASKAKAKLGWEPKVTFHELVREMVASDIELFKKNPIA